MCVLFHCKWGENRVILLPRPCENTHLKLDIFMLLFLYSVVHSNRKLRFSWYCYAHKQTPRHAKHIYTLTHTHTHTHAIVQKMPVNQKPLKRIGIFWYQFTPRKLLSPGIKIWSTLAVRFYRATLYLFCFVILYLYSLVWHGNKYKQTNTQTN